MLNRPIKRHLNLVLLYPPLVTGLFEVPRYLYWTQGRLAPALVALALIGWWATRNPQRAPFEWKDMLRVRPSPGC